MIARARRTDPETSHEAAASVTGVTRKQAAVWGVILLYGPITDEAIAGRYASWHAKDPTQCPPQSPSGLRTRRAELVAAGLVQDSGLRRTLSSGRRGIAWQAFPSTRPAPDGSGRLFDVEEVR